LLFGDGVLQTIWAGLELRSFQYLSQVPKIIGMSHQCPLSIYIYTFWFFGSFLTWRKILGEVRESKGIDDELIQHRSQELLSSFETIKNFLVKS
jgi:hypothetical protein